MSVIPKQIKQNIYNYFVSCDGKNQTPVLMAIVCHQDGGS